MGVTGQDDGHEAADKEVHRPVHGVRAAGEDNVINILSVEKMRRRRAKLEQLALCQLPFAMKNLIATVDLTHTSN